MTGRWERTEELSKKTEVWMLRVMRSIDFEQNAYLIEELFDLPPTKWPMVMIPEGGWHGENEDTTFCGGDKLVGIGVRSFKRIGACVWEDRFNDISVIKEKAETSFIIPLETGSQSLRHDLRVKIIPIKDETHVFPSMGDLWVYHPRYAKTTKTFTIGNVKVKRDTMIELNQLENNCIKCYMKETDTTVFVPMSAKGNFTIVPDKNVYALKTVYEQFNLPQHVVFETNSAPEGCLSNILLLEDTKYEVLITCCLANLYLDDRETDLWGSREEDFKQCDLVYIPRPVDDNSQTGDIPVTTWNYDPKKKYNAIVYERASVFKLSEFKDVDAVLKPDTASMSCKVEDIYDYIKVHDFLGIQPPGEAKTGSLPVRLPSTYNMKSPSEVNPYSEGPAPGRAVKADPSPLADVNKGDGTTSMKKQDCGTKKVKKADSFGSLSKIFSHKSKKKSDLPFTRSKSDSESACDDPIVTNTPKAKTLPMMKPVPEGRPPLPPVPKDDNSDSDDSDYQVPGEPVQPPTGRKMSNIGRGLPPVPPDEDSDYECPEDLAPPPPEPIPHPCNQRPLPPVPPGDEKPPAVKVSEPIRKRPPIPVPDDATKRSSDAHYLKPSITRPNIGLPKTPEDLTKGAKGPLVKPRTTQVGSSTSVPPLKKPEVPAKQDGLVKSVKPQTSVKPQAIITPRVPLTSHGSGDTRPSPTPGQKERMVRYPPETGDLRLLSDLTYGELADIFVYMNLKEIGETIKKNKVSGGFFEDLDVEETFADNPFNASKFQLKQIQRIKDGDYD